MNDARDVTLELGGRWYGKYGRSLCPVCGGKKSNPPLSVSQGRNGLLLYCFKGCDFRDIRDAIGRNQQAVPSETDLIKIREREAADAAKKAAQAERCWNETQPITGSVAETYLRHRGVASDLPDTMRFHPECWHSPTAKRHPALVALIEGGTGFAVHRTYLQPDGTGKAVIEPNKMMLGKVAGGVVRLADGPGRLLVGEGIESTLAAAQVLKVTGSVWASLSTSGMEALDLPSGGDLLVAVDGDDAGRKAGETLAARAVRSGWTVNIADPGDGLDFANLVEVQQ
jgi:hypothetical protein